MNKKLKQFYKQIEKELRKDTEFLYVLKCLGRMEDGRRHQSMVLNNRLYNYFGVVRREEIILLSRKFLRRNGLFIWFYYLFGKPTK